MCVRLFGLYRSVADCGYVAGPLLLGWLAGVRGYSAPLLLTAAMFLVSGALFARFAPELYRRPTLPAFEQVPDSAPEPSAR